MGGDARRAAIYVSRHVCGADAGPDRRGHGRDRRDGQLRRTRAALGAAGSCAARRRAAAGRRGGAADREQPAGTGGLLGRAAFGPVHHRGQLPAQAGGGRLHRQRQRRRRADRLRRAGRDRDGAAGPGGQVAAGLRRRGARVRQLRGHHRRRLGHAPGRPAARCHHAVLLRHHRTAQGRAAAAARRPGGRARRGPGRTGPPGLRLQHRHRLPVARADLPRRAAAFLRRGPGPGRHRGHDEAVRRRAGPAGDR